MAIDDDISRYPSASSKEIACVLNFDLYAYALGHELQLRAVQTRAGCPRTNVAPGVKRKTDHCRKFSVWRV